jgi:DNA-binding NarL/FixJ family response regulator
MDKVLIVEDHGVVRAGICHIIQQEANLEIVGVAENGNQALELVKNGLTADVVLSDLHLGDISGIDLARELRQLAPELKVLMLTAECGERYLSEAFKAGAKGYLLKETDSEELVYAINKVAQGRHFICTGLAERLCKRLAAERNLSTSYPDIELSERESEILHLLADGLTNLEIADRLFTSRRTVEGHRLSLLQKTGARNGLELIKLAMLNGLLQNQEKDNQAL